MDMRVDIKDLKSRIIKELAAETGANNLALETLQHTYESRLEEVKAENNHLRGIGDRCETRTQEVLAENEQLQKMIEGILQIWDFSQNGDPKEVKAYLAECRAAIAASKGSTPREPTL